MKTYTLTLLGMFGATVVAATEINESMDASADGIVSISNVAGSVDVQGWSRKQVEITGELGSDIEELIFERDGDEIDIKVKTREEIRVMSMPTWSSKYPVAARWKSIQSVPISMLLKLPANRVLKASAVTSQRKYSPRI